MYDWLPEFRGDRDQDGDLVSEADLLRHEQLYAPDFPQQWRDFVIAETAAAPGITSPASDEGAVAREVLGRAGALPGLREPGNQLLTTAEGPRVGTATRSPCGPSYAAIGHPGGYTTWSAASPYPRSGPRRSGRPSGGPRALNEQVLWRGRIRLVERLSTTRLRRHLEKLWQLPPGDDELLLAAAPRPRSVQSTKHWQT